MVQLDPQRRAITIQGQQRRYTLSVRDVNRVAFSQSAPAYGTDGRIVLRSGGSTTPGQRVTIGPIPMSGLRIYDSDRGRAMLQLSPRYASQATPSQVYVVEEMQFNAQQGTVTVVATPYR